MFQCTGKNADAHQEVIKKAPLSAGRHGGRGADGDDAVRALDGQSGDDAGYAAA